MPNRASPGRKRYAAPARKKDAGGDHRDGDDQLGGGQFNRAHMQRYADRRGGDEHDGEREG